MRTELFVVFGALFFGLFFQQCSKPFEAESLQFVEAVVVEGQLTSQLKHHVVKLSYTRPVSGASGRTLGDAEVWVMEDEAKRLDFQEIRPGYYQSTEMFAGKASSVYQLFFILSEGKQYQSDPATLLPPVPIDRLHDRYEIITNTETKELEPGLQFFIDTHDPLGTSKHFRYEWEEAYQLKVPYISYYDYEIETDEVFERSPIPSPCYVTESSSRLLLGTTTGTVGNQLVEMPLRHLPDQSDALSNRYSILVRQYSLGERAYNFYKNVIKNNEQNGSLFDAQQGNIIGNVYSSEDSGEAALGFFEVSGCTEQRYWFTLSDVDPRYTGRRFRYTCSPSDVFTTTRDSLYIYTGTNSILNFTDDNYTLGSTECTTCANLGSLEAPDFWVE